MIITVFALIEKLDTEEQKTTARDICERYTDTMISYAMQFFHNQEDAEDVVHDALVRVIRNIDKFIGKPEYEVKALLRIYTQNVAISQYNKQKKEGVISYNDEWEQTDSCEESDYTQSDNSIDVSAEDQYDFDNDVSTLFKYVKSLKEIDRQIIIYRFHYNYTIREISNELQMPESTVSTRFNRALVKIKKMLGEKNNGRK